MAYDDDPRADDRYPVMRQAIEDSFWHLFGTLTAVLLYGFVFLLGMTFVVFNASGWGSSVGTIGVVFGIVVMLGAVVQCLRLFGLVSAVPVLGANRNDG